MDRDRMPPKRAQVVTAWVACAAAVVLCAGTAQADMEKRKDSALSAVAGNMELFFGGRINELARIADNGTESSTQFLNNEAFPNRVYVRGRTTEGYGNGMSWGFKAEWALPNNPSDQADIPDESASGGVEVRSAYAWWDSGGLGKTKIGYQPGFNRYAGRADLSGTKHAQNNDNRPWAGIQLRDGTAFSGVTAGTLFRDYEPMRADGISYYSPTVAGFQFGVTYGNDDSWQYGVKYYGELESGLRAKAALGYNRNTENATSITGVGSNTEAEDSLVGSGSVALDNGLTLTAAYGIQHPADEAQFTNFGYYAKVGYWLTATQAVSVDYGLSRGTVDPGFSDKMFGDRYGIGWERDFDPYIVYASLEQIKGDRQASGATDVDAANVLIFGVQLDF
jgi:hypothetical protein